MVRRSQGASKHDLTPSLTDTLSPALAAFDAKAEAWEEYLASPLGRLRVELSLHYLTEHLDSLPGDLKVLDAGGGTGSYAIPLARRGYQVCLLDFSSQMLAIAREKIECLDASLLERIDLCQASAEEIARFSQTHDFDLILCHTLLEYVPDPLDLVQVLGGVLKDGGLISLLLTSPHADPVRFALVKQDLQQAYSALSGSVSSADLFGLSRRILPMKLVGQTMAEIGIKELARYGVRTLADYLPPEKLADPEFFSELLELESALGRLHPYKLISRYTQFLGRKT
jgi:S-adenosylmethionine-dependent methyltransferase